MCEKLLKEIHIQWQIAENKTQEEKDSNDENEVAATATQIGSRKKPFLNPDKDKTFNHCKKKGHMEIKCWKKHPELTHDKVKAVAKKQTEKKSEKSSTTATAIGEGEIILNTIELENENIKLYQFDMNDAYYTAPIKEDIVYLQNIFDESDKSWMTKRMTTNECPHATLLNDLAEMEPEPKVQDNDILDLDLSLNAVAKVIADSTLPTEAHILEI